MLRIWGRNDPINVQKVMWAVGELGLEHERIDAGRAFGGPDAPAFAPRSWPGSGAAHPRSGALET
jgi:glutathione S-transferase